MWIVALALRRPYTFVVVALLLLILGPIVIFRTPTDIFPNINIPVVSILWNYGGPSSYQMRYPRCCRTLRRPTPTVGALQYTESQRPHCSLWCKRFFSPGAHT